MKRFTKGCLTTALVLFIAGLVLCVVCGLLGGFKQIREMDGIRDIPFGFHLDADGEWELGFFRHNGEIGRDWEEERYFRISEGKENEVSLNAAACTELDIELAECSLYLKESEDDQIRVRVSGDTLRYYWTVDGSTLCLRNAGRRASHTDDKVYVSIPADHMFRELTLNFGEGVVNAAPLQAEEVEMNIGAGVCELQEILADEAEITVGAGQLFVTDWTSRTADIEVGAGDFTVQEAMNVSEELEINMNMGSAVINGTIAGDLYLICGMGDVTMNLTGSEDDHSYSVECSMGDVQVGSHDHGGFATSRSWNDGKEDISLFDIECNMGSVTIAFEE